MQPIKEAAGQFLSHKRIAVTGVSRKPENHGSNVVYNRLKERISEVWMHRAFGGGSVSEAPRTMGAGTA
jgi:hypothetical protein